MADVARVPPRAQPFVGREAELVALDAAWSSGRARVVSLVAWAGAGKSALVAEWLAGMAADGWRGAAKVYGWSFYSQGSRDDGAASGDLFVNRALTFFGDPAPDRGGAWERGERLSALVGRQRALLVLDGLEPLQEAERAGGRLRAPALVALLRGVAAGGDGLCVVTSRQPVIELAEFESGVAARVDLEPLGEHDGAALLERRGASGDEDERGAVARAAGGHALTLTLLGRYVAEALGGDVRRWRETSLEDGGSPSDQARRVMEAYDRWLGEGPERAILRVVGLFERPASAGCLAALQRSPIVAGVTDALVGLPRDRWDAAVDRLRHAGLLAPVGTARDASLDAHPLVRECFGAKLERENPDGFRAAHGRLYEHLRDHTDWRPDTVEGLQPLYQAVGHGCKAGRHAEARADVLRDRIGRVNDHYSTKKLGMFGEELAALSGFFEGDWARPVRTLPELDRTRVLANAAYVLRALGRLDEAAVPMQAGMEADVARSDWLNAAISSGNLTELHAARGALGDALEAAQRAAEFAVRSGDGFQRSARCTDLAHVLHLLGRRAEARSLFERADAAQAREQPQFPLLYSLQGRRFCDLLLDLGEAQAAELRARQTLAWAVRHLGPLDVGLDQLSIGAARHACGDRSEARAHFALAIDRLREAGHQDYLAAALVLRAAFLRTDGDRDGARRNLDEARVLAARCGMRIVECDAGFERARQALDAGDLGLGRALLDEARALATACGYRRRDPDAAALEARFALAAGDRAGAQAAYERARALADAERLRSVDAELAAVAASL